MNVINQRIIKKNKHGKVKQQGYLVAFKKNDGTIRIGFSLCSKYDIYDKEIAQSIALGRANQSKTHKVPQSIKQDIENFKLRCQKYFKTTQIEV